MKETDDPEKRQRKKEARFISTYLLRRERIGRDGEEPLLNIKTLFSFVGQHPHLHTHEHSRWIGWLLTLAQIV